jgi:methyltransferase
MGDGVWLLAFVTMLRLAEFAAGRRNAEALRTRGAVEFGQSHYPLIVAFHAAWLVGLWWFGTGQPLRMGFVALFALVEVLRAWTVATLGERYTTRIIVLPGAPPIRRGPYRRLRHPDTILMALEIAVVPLALELPVYAAVFSLVQIPLLMHRMAIESAALAWAASQAAPEAPDPEWPGRLAGR